MVTEMVFSVTLVTIYKGTCKLGNATGFFYQKNDAVYLITNKHVVHDKKEEFFPDRLSVRLHLKGGELGNTVMRDIPLYTNDKPTWLEIKGKDIDVVAIRVSKELLDGCAVRRFKKEDLPPNDIILEMGQDLVVLCYPHGEYDEKHNLPLVRKGSVASAYGILYKGECLFLIDSQLHPGTSGAPVLTKPSVNYKIGEGIKFNIGGQEKSYLVGIHSASKEYLSLSKVWYSDVIEDILKGNTS